ncbi:hypothetical protein [Rufibacter quisquiliarum]|uniref:DUF885 domain-containing protein n=1 Tax=Rufibacter quisquiliarum TaxID=1549639 RepID=A0A839GKX2_9BACT|nr:hypothetical protein [Rufibacter quisquiliarum]MBA9076235.1 hypothetical protein [Rufibacter quisquiliarum]
MNLRKLCLPVLLPLLFLACSEKNSPKTASAENLNQLAAQYVRLGLEIGQYDPDFVDAYYGPDSLKPTAPKLPVFPKDTLLARVNRLLTQFQLYETQETPDSLRTRAHWISQQLVAFGRRIRIFAGEYGTFDEESKDLFGVEAPHFAPGTFPAMVRQLDSLLPGKGTVQERYQKLASRFHIPKEKLDTVFKTAVAEARRRTLQHFQLPAQESFTLEYVTQKPWSGYNWYKGNLQSVIQVNTDLPKSLNDAILLACHEGYPGHHVYNALLEKHLYQDKGHVEISLYPLFSPQSFIAEGSANFGVQVAFPPAEHQRYAREVLLPLTGMDTTNLALYYQASALMGKLNYVRNDVGRKLLAGAITEAQAAKQLMEEGLYEQASAEKSVSFIQKYRSYVINYNYGQDLVQQYIEAQGGTPENTQKRWQLFGELLSNQITPGDLSKKVK